MADTPATAWSDIMTNVVGNVGGALQSLNSVTLLSGRIRRQVSRITLASQESGTVIHVARLPLYAALEDIEVQTDTSLGSTTIKFGDAHNGNSAIYGAAATLTSTNTRTRFGPPLATWGVAITSGYDYLGNLVTPFMPQVVSPVGGAMFEDIIMTTGAATAPSSGTLVVSIKYVID